MIYTPYEFMDLFSQTQLPVFVAGFVGQAPLAIENLADSYAESIPVVCLNCPFQKIRSGCCQCSRYAQQTTL